MRWMWTTVVLAFAAACQDPVPPHGEVVVIVDTDLPVPRLAARLRADVFADDGTWLSSRDFGLGRSEDWPASFSLYTTDDSAAREVLVRLRVYPERKVRDYIGERFFARPTYTEPYAANLEELCSDTPELVLGQELTLRRGPDPVTTSLATTDCPYETESGAVAASVRIDEAATYRFAVRSTFGLGQSNLFLRGNCADRNSEVACAANPDIGTPEPELVVDLSPGSYTLIETSRLDMAPADVVLRGARADAWDEAYIVPEPEPLPATPRLVADGVDVTPPTEPQPRLAVDRLLHIRIEPGVVKAARVTMEGACIGTMARLAATDVVDVPRMGEATTCSAGVSAPLSPAELVDEVTIGASQLGTFGIGETCDQPNEGEIVCVPGGVFVFGSPLGTLWDIATLPERPAVMSRFWLDRNEVTVARFRAALANGLVPPDGPASNGPENPDCVWTLTPGDKEDYGMSCTSWYDARAFCQWVGGDLPTEAQWEYAASAAARAAETKYAYGDELPGCAIAAIALASFDAGSQCFFEGFGQGPQPVDARASTDVTPIIGVIGMTGGLMEHTLDSALPYDHPCWDANDVQDPACIEVSAPRHVARGGAWYFTPQHTLASQRLPLVGRREYNYLGFRCAYATPPP